MRKKKGILKGAMCLSSLSVLGQHRLTFVAIINAESRCHQEQPNSISSQSQHYSSSVWVYLLFLSRAEIERLSLYHAAGTKVSKSSVILNHYYCNLKTHLQFYIKWILKDNEMEGVKGGYFLQVLHIFPEISSRRFMQVPSSKGFYPVSAVSLEGQ